MEEKSLLDGDRGNEDSKKKEGDSSGTQDGGKQETLPDVDWKKYIPEDLKSEGCYNVPKTLQDVLKSYAHAQKMIGADKIVVPNKYTTPEQWKEVFVKLGLPTEKDKYQINFKAEEFKPDFVDKFREVALANNILPHQAQALFDFYDKQAKETMEGHANSIKAKVAKETEELKKEWGAAYDKNLGKALIAIKHYDNEKGELLGLLKQAGVAYDNKVVKLFAKLGEGLKEASFEGKGESGFAFTPVQSQAFIDKVMGDKTHPYHDNSHPAHKQALEEMTQHFGNL